MTSHSKIAQFNGECIGRLTDTECILYEVRPEVIYAFGMKPESYSCSDDSLNFL